MSMLLGKLYDCCKEKDKPTTREGVLALRPAYDPGESMTKQSFKDSCDVNKILKKHGINHVRRHYNEFAGEFGDFSDVPDLFAAKIRLDRGQAVFNELSAEIRREFGNDMFAFYEYANDPANADDLREKLETLQSPGDQLQVNRVNQADLASAVSGLVEAASALEGASLAASGAEKSPEAKEPEKGSEEG